jgi:hypothetical protein
MRKAPSGFLVLLNVDAPLQLATAQSLKFIRRYFFFFAVMFHYEEQNRWTYDIN